MQGASDKYSHNQNLNDASQKCDKRGDQELATKREGLTEGQN